MNLHSIKKVLKSTFRKLRPIKPKTVVDIKIDPVIELKTYLEQTDISDLKKIEDYAFLQSHGPLHFFPKNNAWLVTGYDEISQILKNTGTFGADLYETNALFDENNLAFRNVRSTIKNIFSKELYSNLEIIIIEKSKEILERLSTRSKFDFNLEFSEAISIESVCYILGVKKTLIIVNDNYLELEKNLQNLILNEVEAEDNKLIFHLKRLIKLNELSEEDAIRIVIGVWIGGIDSTKVLISRMMYELIKDEQIVEKIKQNKHLQIKFIEECIRLYPPFIKITRKTRNESVFFDTKIPNNSIIFLDIFSANRDKTKFDEPNRISFDKNNQKHLSFGHGIFQCIGMGLARFLALNLLNKILLESVSTFEIENVKLSVFNKVLWTEEFNILELRKKNQTLEKNIEILQ
jgi:cytochrome P450